jgi:DNA-binding NarL/FixJ family response regulator
MSSFAEHVKKILDNDKEDGVVEESSELNVFKRLTPSEFGVANSIALGASNKEVGENQGIEHTSVKVYLVQIFHKLGVKNRLELALLVHNQIEEFLEAKLVLDEKKQKKNLRHST